MRSGGAESGREGRGYGVDALDLIYVGGVERGGEGAEGQKGRVRRRDGMGMKTRVSDQHTRIDTRNEYILENIWYRAMFGVDEGSGLGVAVGRDGTPSINSESSEEKWRRYWLRSS